MKQLREYDTPELKAAKQSLIEGGFPPMLKMLGEIEQRLAACRDALEEIQIRSYNQHLAELARETLALTAPK